VGEKTRGSRTYFPPARWRKVYAASAELLAKKRRRERLHKKGREEESKSIAQGGEGKGSIRRDEVFRTRGEKKTARAGRREMKDTMNPRLPIRCRRDNSDQFLYNAPEEKKGMRTPFFVRGIGLAHPHPGGPGSCLPSLRAHKISLSRKEYRRQDLENRTTPPAEGRPFPNRPGSKKEKDRFLFSRRRPMASHPSPRKETASFREEERKGLSDSCWEREGETCI